MKIPGQGSPTGNSPALVDKQSRSAGGTQRLAKVTKPHATLVHRERLFHDLATDTAPVTWLMAAAGSGKTSLCIEWAESLTTPVAWLRTDEADRDIASFLHFLSLSLAHCGMDSAWQAPTLAPEHLQVPHGYIRIFLRSLAEFIQPHAVLIIDDAHHCQDSPFFSVFLERCVDELPSGVKVIVASRNAPPEGCARILSHGHMKTIGGEAMAFTPDEARQLLALNGVSDQQVATAICDYSRGWAIGIVLMGSVIKRRLSSGRPAATGEFLTEVVSSYLANEVFGMLADEEQQFLLSICYLPHFSAQGAQDLSHVPQSRMILDRLLAIGWLVVEYEGGQFGLHDLFRQFLQKQASERLPDSRRLAVLEESIRHLSDEGDVDEAIELALRHSLLASAGKLIESHAANAYAAARHHTLSRWIQSLPVDQRGTWHHYWLGRAVWAADSALARDALLRACEGFAAEGNDLYRYSCLALVISSYAFNGAATESIRDVLQKHVDPGDYDRINGADARGQFAFAIFAALLVAEPGHPDFALWESRTLDALDKVSDRWAAIRIFTWMAIHYYFSGNYKRILALGIRAGELASSADLPPYARYLSYFGLLFIPLVGDRAALEGVYREALASSDTTGFRNMDGHYALNRAVGYLLDGDSEATVALLQTVAIATPPRYFNLLGHLNSVRAWAANWLGDTSAAREYAALAREAGRKFGSVPYEVWSAVSECIADALSGSAELLSSVAALRQLATSANYPLGHIHADLLEAWHWMQCGDRDAACRSLGQGLSLLGQHSEGYLTSAVPQILQPLCALAFEADIESDVADKLVKAFRLSPPDSAGRRWPWPVVVQCFGSFALAVNGKPLTSTGKSKFRQLDLLKYLAAHAPNPMQVSEAADALWPDAEGDAARSALDTTLSRLRTLIGKECIRVENGAMWLEPKQCWSDVQAVDAMLKALEVGDGVLSADTVMDIVRYLRGDFLAGETSDWAQVRRTYWHRRTLRVVSERIAQLRSDGERLSAIAIAERLLEIWPYADQLTGLLMRMLVEEGRPASAIEAYNHFCRAAAATVGSVVPAELRVLAEKIGRQGEQVPS